MDPELTSYAASMPDSFPDNAAEITLKPGSVLFVPRGVWHKTHAVQGDSLSLNFTFTAPTWIDILTAALRGRLAQSSEWRETADNVSDAENCHEALDKFDMLLAQLAHEMPRWRASDILQATEMDHFPLE
jgi:50S ribosomal protein L16 3-hydroxylase